MKRKLVTLLLSLACLLGAGGFAACNEEESSSTGGGNSSSVATNDSSSSQAVGWGNSFTYETAYAEAQSLGYAGSLEEFIALISGTDGKDGVNGTNGKDGVNGTDGKDGINGVTPHIGANGNWWIGETDTGVKAEGKDGSNGSNGSDGDDGTNGVTPHIGANGNWWIGETDTGVKAEGKDGEDLTACAHANKGEWVVRLASTCESIGVQTQACGDCGFVEYAFTPAENHTFSAYYLEKNDTHHTQLCTTCGEFIVSAHFFGEDSACDVCGISFTSGLAFTLNNDNASYSVSNGTCEETCVVVPALYNGLPVTAVANSGFADSAVSEITIPSSVTKIGWHAFYNCSSLTNVSIPDSVTYVHTDAFYGCSNAIQTDGDVQYVDKWVVGCNTDVESVSLRADTVGIANYGFSGCSSLTAITLPDSLTVIGDYAFRNCAALASATLPDGLTSIGWEAFYQCYALTAISIPASVTEMGSYAFYKCTLLSSVTFSENSRLTAIAGSAFSACSSLSSIAIPSGVTTIGEYAFSNCTGLTSITIPSNVTTIGNYAFRNCAKLSSITIPSSVTKIGSCAFYGCTGLTSVTFENADGWFVTTDETATSGDGVTVTDATQNATYFTDTYRDSYWKRTI